METNNESLKQQFEFLQQQQKKKLMRRKQKNAEKENIPVDSEVANSFGVGDNLELKLADPPATSSYASEELVSHLNDQIREIKDENGRLYKLLSERDFEIRNMKKKRDEEKNALGGMQVTNETAATKIVELSKKVRELTSELESEKMKCKQFQKKYCDVQMQMSSIPQETRTMMGSAVSLKSQLTEEKTDDTPDPKILQDKLKHTENKLADYRNQCQILKQELKIANKVLHQELGDDVNIQTMLNTNSNWRGRAQQILILQTKVEDLKSKLEAEQRKSGRDISLEDQFMGKISARRKTQDEKYREDLRKMERERKEAKEQAASQLQALEEDHASLKQKMEAVKARNKVLSNESKGLKQQLQTLLEKGHNDDELIQALMKQQEQLKKLLENSTDCQRQNMEKQHEQMKDLSVKAQQDNNIVEQLKAIVAEKEAKVRVLEDEINDMKASRMQRAQVAGVTDVFQMQDPWPPSGSRPATGQSIVLTSVSPPGSRQSERPSTVNNAILDSARTASRISIRPPSASIDKQVIADLHYQCQEYRTVMQVAEVEKEKLAELVRISQKRIDEATVKLSECEAELIRQRRKNVALEKQLGKAQLDPNTKSSANPRIGRKTTGKMSGSLSSRETVIPATENDDLDNTDITEVLTNLEIQRDENEALKAALQSTLHAKEEDLKIYSETMEETKKVFLQALRQLKQDGS